MTKETHTRPIEILLVEDSPSDALMTQEALLFSKLSSSLHTVDDGEKAIDFLRRMNGYEGSPRPDLILLDLNLPRKSGIEVLDEIKQDDNLKMIPIVVLTTSKADDDVAKAYRRHANCYITKPVEFNRFADVVRAIDDFWFQVVTRPPVMR